jgi:hypothetical protein
MESNTGSKSLENKIIVVMPNIVVFNSGKARRGDGNDLTPNPRKLHSIGRELDKLNRLINDMTPVSELPMAVRPKSRKEKNKLASRFAVFLLNILKQKAFNKYISLVLQSMPLEEKGAA